MNMNHRYDTQEYRMHVSEAIVKDDIVTVYQGDAYAGVDTASHEFVGRALNTVTADAAGLETTGEIAKVLVAKQGEGVWALYIHTGETAYINQLVYVVDHLTVGLATYTTNDVQVGRILKFVDSLASGNYCEDTSVTATTYALIGFDSVPI